MCYDVSLSNLNRDYLLTYLLTYYTSLHSIASSWGDSGKRMTQK